MDEFERIVVFDGVCVLCNNTVQFIVRHDSNAKFKFVTAQSKLGSSLLEKYGYTNTNLYTILLIKAGHCYQKSDAAFEIIKDLDGSWKYFAWFRFVPRPIRDWGYMCVSKNRYQWFGRNSECMLPNDALKERFLG